MSNTDWEQLWDDIYSKDFAKFLWLTWLHLGHSAPTPIQIDIAHHLQYGPQRTCIEALRGIGKSYITCDYAAWRLRLDPNEAILIISASKDKAADNASFIRDLIYSMPILEPLRLSAKNRSAKERKQRDSVIKFDVRGAELKQVASVTCSGIEGNVTGKRATIIIPDDIEDPLNAISVTQRQKIIYLASEFEAVIKPGSSTRIIYLGTPHSSASIYTELPSQGYAVKMWPAVVPDQDWMSAFGEYLGDYIQSLLDKGISPGTPTDPRFPEEELARKKVSMKGRYPSQFLLDPRANDAKSFPFRMEDLIVMDCDADRAPIALTWSSDPRYKLDLDPTSMAGDYCYTYMYADPRQEPYEFKVLAIDPSGKGKDKTAICIMGKLHGKLHCLELEGLDGGFDETVLKHIAALAFEYKVNVIYSEKNYGGGMFDALLAPYLRKYEHHGWKCKTIQKHNTTQKEVRICDTVEPVWSAHRIVMDKAIIKRDESIRLTEPYHTVSYQFTQMTRERGAVAADDLADVFSMATSYFVDQMGSSEDESIKKREEQEKDEFWEEVYARAAQYANTQKQKTFLSGNAKRNQAGMFN